MRGRLVGTLERGLTRAVERRVGGSSGNRRPGRLERRLVAALERRLAARSPQPSAARGWARLGGTLIRRRPGGRAATRQHKTLRALAVSLLARALVKALLRIARIFSRGLVGRPMRRLVAFLARRAFRAGPSGLLALLAFLGAAFLLAYRALMRRVGEMPAVQQTAIKLGARGGRHGLAILLRLVGRLLGRLTGLLRRELGRAVERYSRSRHPDA